MTLTWDGATQSMTVVFTDGEWQIANGHQLMERVIAGFLQACQQQMEEEQKTLVKDFIESATIEQQAAILEKIDEVQSETVLQKG